MERPPYERIRTAARADRVDFRAHALERTGERLFTVADVVHVLRTAENVWPDGPPETKWRVLGRDLDGEKQMVVVTIVAARLTVVTVIARDDER